ncbi:MAG: hypothetical protein GX066_06995 [Clostridiaceae bacterium]|nr:hypothetical protein [Clostridiaceae bacterium]
MKCIEANEVMMKYFDGELNDIDTYHLKQHIRNCSVCGEQYSLLSDAIDYIESQPLLEPRDGFEECVMREIDQVFIKKKGFPKISLHLFYAAASAIFLMIMVWMVIFLHSISSLDFVGVVLNSGSTIDVLNKILVAAESSYKTVMIVGNSVFDIYYVLLRNYYDLLLSVTAISVITYIMSTRVLKHD